MMMKSTRRPVLDPGAIGTLEILGRENSVNLVACLATLYEDSARQRRTSLRQAGANGRSRDLERAARELRAASAPLGALRLARLCRAIETRASRRPSSDFSTLLQEVDRELDCVLAALSAVPHRATATSDPRESYAA
jgi:HPt (histidine-containing phosphotransfer) domain-containing protein